ncbi:hypothetical protein F7725_005519 [Dissostichus mawsoni]|uniref:Wolframin n=1 Tax=Dissostichus mawsoni TaxID=36200 RepID=A0A7J5YRH6_DISMA|nr:hypothetical protein F7725_005519 [Dissostichus mawsoni]
MVVPPASAALVPWRKSSAGGVPRYGFIRQVLASIPPGGEVQREGRREGGEEDMENDVLSTAVNTQGSCPILDGPSSLPHKFSSCKGSKPLSPTVLSEPAPKPSSPPPNKTANCSAPEIPKMSSLSKLKSASFISANMALNTQTDSSDSSSPPASTVDPATSSSATVKRTFASMAKRVIIQERLRKAEEDEKDIEDDDEPEEDLSLEQLEEKATAGDARAQTRLAQHYLLLSEDKDTELNSRLAVNWLIQAAKQGRKGASRALQHCWIQRKGITPENEVDVRKLATESRFELAVRKAAMMMYWKLNPERKNKVAVSEMLENVGQVNAVPGGMNIELRWHCKQESCPNLRPDPESIGEHASQMVDLDDFVEMTKKYAQGIVPSTSQTDSQVEAKTESPTPNDRREEILQYPLHAVIEMKQHLVDWASRAGVQWLSTAIPTQHVNALIFFFIISNLTVDLFAFTWENFRALTSLLTRFEPSLDVEQAETNFGWNNLEPYLYFIVSVFLVIFSFPVADKGWIPCSELSTVAIFFTAVSYKSLSPTAATYARRAMVIEVASSLCCLTQFLPKKMTVLRLLGRTVATLPLGESVVLKLSLPCLLYVYLFYLFFSMARMRGFRGTYCFLVPYLVCFMWCEFSVVLLQSSSAVGLMRTCVAYFLFLFALPVLAFGLAAMLLIQVFKWFLELELMKVIVTLVVCAIPVTLRLWTRFSMSILDVFHSLTHRGPVKLILLCISMVILFFSIYVYHAEGQKVYNSTLTWRKYSQVCGPPAWELKGKAQTQLFCSHLHGHRVTWIGRFKHIRVADTDNGAQSVINMLPVFLGDWLRCLYGEKYPKCEPKNDTVANLTAANLDASATFSLPILLGTQEEEEMCEIKALAKHTCHIKRFDSHLFAVTVGMIGDAIVEDPARDIVLIASHEFKQVLLNITPGNMVEFSTKLDGSLGDRAPYFELKAIRCLDCVSSLLTGGRQVKIEGDWRRTTMRALKFAFDFFFSPFLSAKIK